MGIDPTQRTSGFHYAADGIAVFQTCWRWSSRIGKASTQNLGKPPRRQSRDPFIRLSIGLLGEATGQSGHDGQGVAEAGKQLQAFPAGQGSHQRLVISAEGHQAVIPPSGQVGQLGQVATGLCPDLGFAGGCIHLGMGIRQYPADLAHANAAIYKLQDPGIQNRRAKLVPWLVPKGIPIGMGGLSFQFQALHGHAHHQRFQLQIRGLQLQGFGMGVVDGHPDSRLAQQSPCPAAGAHHHLACSVAVGSGLYARDARSLPPQGRCCCDQEGSPQSLQGCLKGQRRQQGVDVAMPSPEDYFQSGRIQQRLQLAGCRHRNPPGWDATVGQIRLNGLCIVAGGNGHEQIQLAKLNICLQLF
ncbi:hypothetical protein CYB_1553 [Synechococcus sp. JA-2-3B'a(2-13)]|nr:hypothetical protein CYB_1553 [Synechococcus sp. JA-2-3B'a(2-13)]